MWVNSASVPIQYCDLYGRMWTDREESLWIEDISKLNVTIKLSLLLFMCHGMNTSVIGGIDPHILNPGTWLGQTVTLCFDYFTAGKNAPWYPGTLGILWWCSWLRHCAPSRKVAGSLPSGVTGIFQWHNPSGRTIARGLAQLLTEMNNRNISWG